MNSTLMNTTLHGVRMSAFNGFVMDKVLYFVNRLLGHFLKTFLFLIALLVCGNVRAQEIAYTLNCEKNIDNTSFAQNYDVTINGIRWNAPGNQAKEGYWRIGGSRLSNVDRTITSKDPIQSAISKIVFFHNGTSNETIKVNSISLIVASDAGFSNIIDEKEINSLNNIAANTAGTLEIISTNNIWTENSFYKFTFNITNGAKKAAGFDLEKIEFYSSTSASAETYTVTFNAGTGTCETPSLAEANPGAGITLPTANSPCPTDWTFVGWTTIEITAETTTAPQLYTEGSIYHPTTNETLYAVYQKQDGESGNEFKLSIDVGGLKYVGERAGTDKFLKSEENVVNAAIFGMESTENINEYFLYYYQNGTKIYIGGIDDTKLLFAETLPDIVTELDKYRWVTVVNGNIISFKRGNRFLAYNTSYPRFSTYKGGVDYPYEYTKISLSSSVYHTHPDCPSTTTPTIDCSVSELDFGTIENNQTKELTFTVSGSNLNHNVELTLSGDNVDYFECNPSVITKETDGSVPETRVTVKYKPTVVGGHQAILTIKSGRVEKTITLKGNAEQPQPLPLETPVATEATDITNTSFTANWNAVTNATSYVVNVLANQEIFNEDFSGIVGGDNSTSTGSSSLWAGNNNFTNEQNVYVYEAGGAIKLGTSKKSGSISTKTLDIIGSDVEVCFDVKGWTDVEGDIIVTIGETSHTITYTATMHADFETKSVLFQNVTEGIVKIGTTSKRAFIDNIIVKSNAPIPGSPFTVSSGTGLNITGLSPDTKYCYNVVAKADGYLDSDASNTICATTSNTSCALATPVVTATPTTSTINLQWSPVDGATSYIVSLNAETPQTVTGTSYTFTSLTANTSYNWSVTASSDACTGTAATGTTKTLEQPTAAGVEIVEVDTNGLKLDFHDQNGIASVVIDNEVTVAEGERPIADDVFFSKYFEATGTAKLLGIYNGTNNPIALADLKIFYRDSPSALSLAGFGGTDPNVIMPNEEIIIYNKGTVNVQNCAEEQENFDKWKPADPTKPGGHPALQFGGKGTITLRRGNDIIDIIGALDENGFPVDGNEQPTWGDDPGFTCAGGDNIKTEEIETDYGLSTNRCLLIRRNHVKSGANAVAQNINAFNTLCTEWGGFHIDAVKDTQEQLSCEGFGYVGGFDYQGYYTQYVQLQTTEFDKLTQNPDGTYTLPIPSLHKYSCTNIKLKTLDINGDVIETITYKVPIIVNQNVTTDAETFFHFEGDTCKNCDVVIRDEATLTAIARGKSEFRNVEVYPQATLAVPTGENLTVNSLRMRSNAVEDQIPYANIVGTLNNQTNMLYYDMRINNSAFRFFALPDTIKVSDIKFSNGMPAVCGTDFYVMYYDGEQRTTNGGLQSNWKDLTADSSIWAGNGYNIATGKTKMQELRFELEYDKVIGPDTKQVHVYDHGMNDYKAGTITPNNVGWNLVGNPYLYIYENGEGDGLVYGKLEIVNDSYTWNTTDNVRYITYFNDKGRTYQQDKVNRTLRPFKCFFVQVGNPTNHEQGLMYVTFSRNKAHNPDRQMIRAQRTPEQTTEQYVGIQIALGDKTDKMGISIDNAYTTEYEIGRDLEKMMNYGTLPHMYAYVNNSQKLAFNAIPEWEAQSVIAGVYFPQAGEYTISLDPNDRPTNRVMAVWLTDMVNNVTTNLMLGDYRFYAQRAEQKNRFMIAVELAPEISTSTLVSSTDGVYAYTQQRQVTVCGLAENSVVSVYDALGHLLLQKTVAGATMTEQLPVAGMYIVKVVNAQQNATLKLWVY